MISDLNSAEKDALKEPLRPQLPKGWQDHGGPRGDLLGAGSALAAVRRKRRKPDVLRLFSALHESEIGW